MKKKVIIIPAILIIFGIFLSSIVVTKPGEYRVIKQFGKIVRVEENDGSSYGLSFKIPFVQSETVISSKMILSDLHDVFTGEKKGLSKYYIDVEVPMHSCVMLKGKLVRV